MYEVAVKNYYLLFRFCVEVMVKFVVHKWLRRFVSIDISRRYSNFHCWQNLIPSWVAWRCPSRWAPRRPSRWAQSSAAIPSTLLWPSIWSSGACYHDNLVDEGRSKPIKIQYKFLSLVRKKRPIICVHEICIQIHF